MKKNQKKATPKTPFYAHLLSKQEMQQTNGGGPTKPTLDQAQTQKWPSDGDDSTPINDSID
jgi:hypothetical protein